MTRREVPTATPWCGLAHLEISDVIIATPSNCVGDIAA